MTSGERLDSAAEGAGGARGPRRPGRSLLAPSDQEIQITRLFDAPRQLVFDAFTRPELL